MKNAAWDNFKQTGNINAYLRFKNIENIEEDIRVNSDETIKSKWDSNSRK